MQGLHEFIPTALKAEYINLLLGVGFDTLDFGSFVSPKAIPQLKDTREVLAQLDLSDTSSKLLAIVANLRGAEEALSFPEIDYIGFPFSISETFQQRNTNSSIIASIDTVKMLLDRCNQHNKTAVIYLSMGFGNPYGDPYTNDIVDQWATALVEIGTPILSLSDTTGVSTPDKIKELLPYIMKRFPETEIGLHLHSAPHCRTEKIEAAYLSGCKRFDSALKGFGGCPMAKDDLTGNLATEELISFLEKQGETLNLNMLKWSEALSFSAKVFPPSF